jgi:mRNA interferase HigB
LALVAQWRPQAYSFKTHAGHKGIKATRTQYNAWLAIVGRAVKASYPKASILKGSRVVFNIRATITD